MKPRDEFFGGITPAGMDLISLPDEDDRIDMWRCPVRGYQGDSYSMVLARTISEAEIADRVDHGEDAWDVIEEHTSWIWFSDRRSFRAAWAIVRMIRSGKILRGIKSGEVYWATAVDEAGISSMALELSAHHVAEAA